MTGFGDALFVTASSDMLAKETAVITVAELFERFGSEVPEVTSATSTICVPHPVDPSTLTARVKVPAANLATSGFVQVMFPVPFTGGVLQVQPAGAVSD